MADKKPVAKKPKAIVDVAKPGTSAPSASGRSVIVTNRPILKDPMVVAKQSSSPDKTATGEGSVKIKVTTKSRATPQTAPLEDVVATTEEAEAAPEVTAPETKAKRLESTEPAAQTESVDKPESKSVPQKAAETPEAKPATPADAKPAAAETEEAADEETVPIPSDAEQEAAAAAQAEHDTAIQKLIDGKQYFLKINSVEKRKTKRFVALGIVISILLALAWVDVALDAGLIQLGGVKPATHFFSN